VWNRSPEKTRLVTGAEPVPTPRAAASGASIVVTMLPDDRVVEAVTLGSDGVLRGLSPGGVHVGMSTISVALTRRLAEAHAATGTTYLAAPVFGRPDAAAGRLLWIVPGGPTAEVERCAPLWAALGQGTFPLPTAPQAALAKLAGNFLIAANIEALGEALVLGEKGGIDPDRLLALLTGTIFGSPVVRGYGARIVQADFEPAGFAMPLGLKDVDLALAAGRELGVPLRLGELARERLVQALARKREGYDWSGFATVIREEAGLPAL
jgi:3-hydroxyisobutyrate dehydrogenase-like beta-hydroxyacid dehydrogenase